MSKYEIKGQPIWPMSAAQYQQSMGVHQPWIAEISPHQMAMMVKRARAEYDQKRREEWAASAACKAEYAELLMEAYDLGLFRRDEVGEDVRSAVNTALYQSRRASAVNTALYQSRKASAEVAKAEVLKANEIRSFEGLKKGDRIFSVMYGYGIVEKINRKSLVLKTDNGYSVKASGGLQWKSYNDCVQGIGA
ncbi:hypothetical protein J2T17_007475 [Paenibacillus mucilaginosus]|uniref:hypothetical protein n=1 Tax=Paenibacillus mucilaginosus TaxID=61624 RepID=UPI003D1F5AFD